MEKEKTTDSPTYPGSVPMVRIDGAKIRRLREDKKLTQLYLSTVVGVTTDTISRWENRHYQSIKLENAEKLAQALEVEFEEILKQEEPPPTEPEIEPEPPPENEKPASQPRKKIIIVLTVLLIATASTIILLQRVPKPPEISVSAIRTLPPHVAPGQAFPVLIRVSSQLKEPVSLIIKEVLPPEAKPEKGLPEITNIDGKENSLKWIRRLDTGETVYAYLCRLPGGEALDDQLTFAGSVTLKQNVNDRQLIEGDNSLTIAPYHWADSNRDYMIDDEEILAVYDIYSDIEQLPFDRELIDSLWASSGYTWAPNTKQFITND